ncbi:MAG: rane protein AbrB duplication [Streptosporangiaceae bacterium]|nr:rane protein AbrB duplication [Streptosporangiaceae bacterium]
MTPSQKSRPTSRPTPDSITTPLNAGSPAPAQSPKNGAQAIGRGLALTAACYGAAFGAAKLDVPAPFLLAPLLIGLLFALSTRAPVRFPRRTHRVSQAMVGVLMGSYLAPAALSRVAPSIGPLLLVTVGTVVFSLLSAYALTRTGQVSASSATLGMAPGGSAAIVAAADDLKADSRLVAFSQYLRVALVAVTAPLVVRMTNQSSDATAGRGDPAVMDLHLGPDSPVAVLILIAVVLGGMWGGRLLRLPAPFLLGPMVLTAALTLSGMAPPFAPGGVLKDLVFLAVGLEVGLRFTRRSIAHVRRVFVPVLLATVAVSVACAGLSWSLASAMRIPLMDAYLATTPGGINAVLATAVATHADLPLVSSVQSLRLFAVVIATPPLLRLGARIFAARTA